MAIQIQTAAEQLTLELTNRARLDPAGEAALIGIDLNEGVAPENTISSASKEPLAMNNLLVTAARKHSQDMIDRNYFDHFSPDPVNNGPSDRTEAEGYIFLAGGWSGENIALGGDHGLLFRDPGIDGRGHRLNILGPHEEMGVGEVSFMLTEDFGNRFGVQFLTGVAFNDTDADEFYSIGEGRNNISIAVTGGPAETTGAAGGYSADVTAGAKTVTFSGGDLAASVAVLVTVAADVNAKVDLMGQSTIRTSVSLSDLGGVTKIIGLGTFGLNLTGDAGGDTIVGALGGDTIRGNGGNDVLDGGAGADTALYSAALVNYSIARLSDGSVRVADIRGGSPDGTDTVRNVEQFNFNGVSRSLAQVVDITDFNVFWHQTSTNDWRDWTMSAGAVSLNLDFGALPSAWDLKATGDFNADGVGDVLWLNSSTGEVRTIQYSGSQIASVHVLGALSAAWAPIGTGDFNGDGTSDIIWHNGSTGELRNWSMQNGTISGNALLGRLAPEWRLIATGDFNGDGTYDIFFRNTATGDVREWLMSNGTLASNIIIGGPSSSWGIAATGDFNHDHTTDIIWRNVATGEDRLWLMANGAVANNIIMLSPPPQWKLIAAGDYDQNGHDDLIWQNSTNGDVREWLLTNGVLTANIALGGTPTDFTTAVNASTHTDFLPSI